MRLSNEGARTDRLAGPIGFYLQSWPRPCDRNYPRLPAKPVVCPARAVVDATSMPRAALAARQPPSNSKPLGLQGEFLNEYGM
jgi:hypothetical protein